MSEPRRVLPGRTYMLTRRCLERRFMFTPRPDGVLTRIFGYCLALLAARHAIEVHASVALGNHWHLVVTDVKGQLPEFLRDAHSFIARCVNALLGRGENVWAVSQPSVVELLDADAVLDKLVYCLGNAVSSGLVASHRAWPGFHTLPDSLLREPRAYRRPAQYFGRRCKLSDEAELHITKPPALAHLSDAEYVAQLERRLAARESELQRDAKKRKTPFRGIAAVLAQDPLGRPETATPHARNHVNPRVASRDAEARRCHLGLLADFQRLYAAARARWRGGDRDTTFPPGTYQLARLHGVRVAEAAT